MVGCLTGQGEVCLLPADGHTTPMIPATTPPANRTKAVSAIKAAMADLPCLNGCYLASCQTFSGCGSCGQVYWHGAHSKRLEQIIDSAVRTVSTSASG
jgi:hypothetical protein